jgi:RNA polymerase sigma-70 factor, ECF subfamily
MAEGPAAGLSILGSLGTRLARWPQFHIARAELLHRAGHSGEAARVSGRHWTCRCLNP